MKTSWKAQSPFPELHMSGPRGHGKVSVKRVRDSQAGRLRSSSLEINLTPIIIL